MTLQGHPSVRVHESTTLHSGRVFDLVHQRIELPSGLRQELDLIEHAGAVAIAALGPDGRLLVVQQYRASVGDWLLEIPAGRLEQDEDPLTAAARELEEETGHRAQVWELLRTIIPAPGFASERIYLYLATDLELIANGGLACDEDEELDVSWQSTQDIIATNPDAKSLIAALLVDRRLQSASEPRS
ncbi:MAG: ADP-ribose pyrophosphatase [Planctomycetota bacterium]|jgi:ADP-ribose pyrophosphatase